MISRKAAADLGVEWATPSILIHPRRTGEDSYGFAVTAVEVIGIHAAPYRFLAYMDASQAGSHGPGRAGEPGERHPGARAVPWTTSNAALFEVGAVSSVQPATVVADTFRDLLGRFIGLLRVVQGAVFLLALAIAFNSASLNLDERARDYATMFAFGVSRRRALALAVAEGALLGPALHRAGPGSGLRPGPLVRGQRVPANRPRHRPAAVAHARRRWRWWWPWEWRRWPWPPC